MVNFFTLTNGHKFNNCKCIFLFLGSIPFGFILTKIFLKQDIRETGSGNIGATNVLRTGTSFLQF